MIWNWEKLVGQEDLFTKADFQKASLRLVEEQILYQSNARQKFDYDLISKFETEFIQVFDFLGCKLDHNRQSRYVAIIPMHAKVGKIPLMHTLLSLVLRKLYAHHMKMGNLNSGVAGVSLEELEMAFNESTGRELKMKPQSDLLRLLDVMKRWGIARSVKVTDANEVTWYVEILPGILSLIGEQSLAMIKAHAESNYQPNDESDSQTDLNNHE